MGRVLSYQTICEAYRKGSKNMKILFYKCFYNFECWSFEGEMKKTKYMRFLNCFQVIHLFVFKLCFLYMLSGNWRGIDSSAHKLALVQVIDYMVDKTDHLAPFGV